ncbi:MAG: hypothetical protein ABIC95_04205 [archaeon]
MKADEFRKNVLVVLPKQYRLLLGCYLKNPQASYKEIINDTGMSAAIIAHAKHDCMNLGFMTNGSGCNVTPTGNLFLKLQSDSKEEWEALHDNALKIDLFRELHSGLGSKPKRHEIFGVLRAKAPENYAKRIIQRIVRRYYQYVIGIKVMPKGRSLKPNEIGNQTTINIVKWTNDCDVWSFLVKKYHLSGDELKHIIEAFPKLAKKEIDEEMLNEHIKKKYGELV